MASADEAVPLLFALLLFFLLCMGVGILYFQYRAVQRELLFCRNVQTLRANTRRYVRHD